MLRRIVSGVALAALFATGAHAQTNPFTESFTFNSPSAANGQQFNNYMGQFNIADPTDLGAGFPIGSSFQIWCVDENDVVHAGQTYNVWVTPLSATNWTHVYVPGGEPGLYRKAAAATTEMSGSGVSSTNDYAQYAIWDILGYPYPPIANFGSYNFDDCHGLNIPSCGVAVSADETAAGLGAPLLSLNQWLVITFTGPGGRIQEFLTLDSFRTFETPVPEPGTMAMLAMGLVGMAGAGMRRRKIKK